MPGIELTQANLSKKNLLGGALGVYCRIPIPVSQEPGKKVPTLAICLWSHLVSHLCLSLSQDGIHSSSLWTRRICSLLNSGGPKMTGCLNPHLQDPVSPVPTIHELKSQFQLPGRKNLVDPPMGVSQRIESCSQPPAEQS